MDILDFPAAEICHLIHASSLNRHIFLLIACALIRSCSHNYFMKNSNPVRLFDPVQLLGTLE